MNDHRFLYEYLFNYIETTPITSTQATPSSRVNLQVVVNPPTLQVQRGQTYELICTVYGADANTNIYWIQEEPERVKLFNRTDSVVERFSIPLALCTY